jgi:hypothetical protein
MAQTVAPTKLVADQTEWAKRMMIFLQADDMPPDVVADDGRDVLHLTYPFLDMGYQVERHAEKLGLPDVHLPPPLAVGEGADPDNGTLVRLLSPYHTLRWQFAAFPPSVKGGVHLATLRTGNETRIAVVARRQQVPGTAVAESAKKVRLFDSDGRQVREIVVPEDMNPPFVIATGAFGGRSESGEDWLAVASRDQNRPNTPVLFFDGTGNLVKRTNLPRPAEANGVRPLLGEVQLGTLPETGRDRLLAWYPNAGVAVLSDVSGSAPQSREVRLPTAPGSAEVFASAFPDQELLFTLNDDLLFSKVGILRGNGTMTSQDIGRMENLFFGKTAPPDDGKSFCVTGGYNGNAMLPRPWNLYRESRDPAVLRSEDFRDWIDLSKDPAIKITDAGNVLFPFFSHWHNSFWGFNIGDAVDPQTGFSLYNVVDANDKTTGNGALFKGDVAIDRQLLLPSRVAFWRTAPRIRGSGEDASRLIGATSLHEMGSPEDYNPGNLRQFRLYAASLFDTIDSFNQRFGTSFPSFDEIDPPRNRDRGEWDSVSRDKKQKNSEFGTFWMDYNRMVVMSTRMVEANRDAVLAGLPPEIVKNHRPGFGENMGISGMTMGTGTGGSVYGPYQELAGTRTRVTKVVSSGHWNTTFGEYGANWDSLLNYTRLKYYWRNGTLCVNMQPQQLAETYRMLATDGEPRPGQTGGVGQIVGVSVSTPDGPVLFNIAQIGAGPERNGLLKSVTADGRFEGSTYVVPFHAKVETVPLVENFSHQGAAKDFAFGPVPVLSHNDQIEFTFVAEAVPSGKVVCWISQEGVPLPGSRREFDITPGAKPFRYTVRNHFLLRDVKLHISVPSDSVKITNGQASAQVELVARHDRQDGVQHRGGVSFALMDRSSVAVRTPSEIGVPVSAAPGEAELNDSEPPVWKNGSVEWTRPLDGRIGVGALFPADEPDLSSSLRIRGAWDNDRVAAFRVYDGVGGKLLGEYPATFGHQIPLPDLPPLRPAKLLIKAVDRSGNESKGLPFDLLAPAIFNFGPEQTPAVPGVRLVTAKTLYSEESGYGWETLDQLKAGNQGMLGETSLSRHVAVGNQPARFLMNAADGLYRIIPIIGAAGNNQSKLFRVEAGDGSGLNYTTRDWHYSMEPFVARAHGGRLALTFSPGTQVSMVLVMPAVDGEAPRWPNPGVKIAQAGYDTEFGKEAKVNREKGRLVLEWNAAEGQVRHYRVQINDLPPTATNLTGITLRDVPLDTPLSITVTAVDHEGNTTPAAPITTRLDRDLMGLIDVRGAFPLHDQAKIDVFVNGIRAEPDPAADKLPTTLLFQPGRNVIAIRAEGKVGGAKISGSMQTGSGENLVGEGWRVSDTEIKGWESVGLDDSAWPLAEEIDTKRFGAHGLAKSTARWFGLPGAGSPAFFRKVVEMAPPGQKQTPVAHAAGGAPSAMDRNAVENLIAKQVIAEVAFQNISLKEALNRVREESKILGAGENGLRFDVNKAVADKPVTITSTNIFIKTLLDNLAELSGSRYVVEKDGRIRFVPGSNQ